jgi:hypothetical protein
MFDMSRGDPYSELTEAEKSALYSNKMHPSVADRLQAERLAAKATVEAPATTGRADRDQQGIAAIPATEEITQSTKDPKEAAAEEAAAAAAAADQPTGPQGGGGGGGIAGAASGMTSYEQELIDALARREKAATQDKWLALAQVGLNLMASKQPTLGGAIGEAGLAGVQAAQGARDQYEEDRLSLTGALEQSRMARAAAAAAAAKGAGGGGGGGLTPYQVATLTRGMRSDAVAELKGLQDYAAALAPGGIPPATEAGVKEYEMTQQQIANLRAQLYGGASADTGAGLYSQTDMTQ